MTELAIMHRVGKKAFQENNHKSHLSASDSFLAFIRQSATFKTNNLLCGGYKRSAVAAR